MGFFSKIFGKKEVESKNSPDSSSQVSKNDSSDGSSFYFYGIMNSFDIINNIKSCHDVWTAFNELNRVYSLDEVKELEPIIDPENVGLFEKISWKKIEDGANLSDNDFSMSGKRVFVIEDVKVNQQLIDYVYFSNKSEREQLINRTNQLSKKHIGKVYTSENMFNRVEVWNEYEEKYGYPPFYFLVMLDWNISEYNYYVDNETNVARIFSAQEECITYGFEKKINNPKELLKWNSYNLTKKILAGITDISTEEKNILSTFDSIKSGYEITDAIEKLATYYLDKDKEMGLNYVSMFKQIDLSLISSNTASQHSRKIGEALFKIELNNDALYFFKKGLELNPRLGVKKIVSTLEKNGY